MATLVACLSTGKGTWGHVSSLITQGEWEHIFLITNQFGKDKYTHEKPFTPIVVDTNMPAPDLSYRLQKELKEKITDTEVGINFISGSGNEHTAILSAILKLGLGVRLVIAGDEGVEEL